MALFRAAPEYTLNLQAVCVGAVAARADGPMAHLFEFLPGAELLAGMFGLFLAQCEARLVENLAALALFGKAQAARAGDLRLFAFHPGFEIFQHHNALNLCRFPVLRQFSGEVGCKRAAGYVLAHQKRFGEALAQKAGERGLAGSAGGFVLLVELMFGRHRVTPRLEMERRRCRCRGFIRSKSAERDRLRRVVRNRIGPVENIPEGNANSLPGAEDKTTSRCYLTRH